MIRPTSFRTRLVALVAISFTIAGAVLLAVQSILSNAIVTAVEVSSNNFSGTVEPPATYTLLFGITTDWSEQRVQLVATVVVLILFAGISLALARWLANQTTRRIAEISHLAGAISETDLSQRLNLPGPDDEIKELGDTFDNMLDRLEQTFRNQTMFIANASHELRTPLSIIRTSLEVPIEQDRVSADLLPAFQRSLTATSRSESLIAALLTLAKINQESIRRISLDLSSILTEIRIELEPEMSRNQIALTIDGTPTAIDGDLDLIRILLRNLLENAVRHNQPGGWVQVTCFAGVTITIENTGPPIDPIVASQLVQPFSRSRTRSGSEPTGHGLGLSIANSIVLAHNGTLIVTARPTGGLRVTLHILPSQTPSL